MPCCSIKWCGKNSTTSSHTKDGISFHRFPNIPEMKEKWLEATQKKNWFPKKHSVMCSRHFTPDCFEYIKKGRRLFSSAVPTLFLPVLGDIFKQSTSKASENSSTNTRLRVLPMVAKVYLYLEKEYEYMKTLNGSNCDLSPLADILKRTAEATGVSEEGVITTLQKENLSDHLPERAKKLRQTIENLQDGSDDDLISDEEMQAEKHADIEVQKEKIGGGEVQKEKIGEGASEPAPCSSTVVYIPSEEQTKMQLDQVYLREVRDTSRAEYGDSCVISDVQVKVEPEEDEVATSVNNLLFQLEPPGTNATVSSDDGNKMEIEQYTFIICNSGENPTTSNPEDTAVKLEPLDD